MPELTVVCAVTPGLWERRADRVLADVLRYSPEIPTLKWVYRRNHGPRWYALLQPTTCWILYLDADVLVTGDVSQILARVQPPEQMLLCRPSPLHGDPRWNEGRYRDLLRKYGLPYRTVIWCGAFLIRRSLAQIVVPGLPRMIRQYRQHRPRLFKHRHLKHDQVGWTLALASAGILNEDTAWAGPEFVSWEGHSEARGIIHHYGGKELSRLERSK